MGFLSGMDIERIGKYINKSNISIDEFVGARIICRGFVGTKITLSGVSIKYAFGAPLEIYITENSNQYEDSDKIKYEVAVIPMGSFSFRVEYQDYDLTTVMGLLAPQTVVLSYNLDKLIFESDVAGVYSLDVPENVTSLVVDAVAGGGGGSYAPAHISGTSGDGGRGGSAGSNVQNSVRAITSPTTLSITIGAGGAGGTVIRASNQGTLAGIGGSTVISGGGLGITLSGGARNGGVGGVGKSNTLKEVGNAGAKGYSSGTGEYAIVGGAGGSGGYYGSTSSGGGGGGGGDGSIFGVGGVGGNGGDGGGGSNIPTYYGRPGYNGTKGSGGGGGGGTGGEMSMSALGGDGGKGGDGYVRIKSRITV